MQNRYYIIITLYHSPNANHGEFIENFEDLISKVNYTKDTLLVIGNYNINMELNTFSKKKLMQCINRLGLYQIIKEFTRVTQESSTLIDLVVTNNKYLLYEVHLTPRISNHSIVTISHKKTKLSISQ